MSLAFTFLGTGVPVATNTRYGSAHLVATADAKVLIDCGSGVSQQLVAAGHPGASVDALVVTHYHSDHVIDFYQLVVSSWHQGRARPWAVHATPAATANMRAQLAAYADERKLRIGHERRPSTDGLEVAFHELREGEALRLGELSVSAFEVDHRPVAPAFGLVCATPAARLVFSGDTRPCESLRRAVRQADLFVCEAFVDREMRPTPGVRSAETVEAVKSYHCTPRQVAEIASEAGARMLALTHLVPPTADRAALIAEVRAAGYAGPTIVGEDLMTVRLPERLVTCGTVALAI
jgi:ribonuclease Z